MHSSNAAARVTQPRLLWMTTRDRGTAQLTKVPPWPRPHSSPKQLVTNYRRRDDNGISQGMVSIREFSFLYLFYLFAAAGYQLLTADKGNFSAIIIARKFYSPKVQLGHPK